MKTALSGDWLTAKVTETSMERFKEESRMYFSKGVEAQPTEDCSAVEGLKGLGVYSGWTTPSWALPLLLITELSLGILSPVILH